MLFLQGNVNDQIPKKTQEMYNIVLSELPQIVAMKVEGQVIKKAKIHSEHELNQTSVENVVLNFAKSTRLTH